MEFWYNVLYTLFTAISDNSVLNAKDGGWQVQQSSETLLTACQQRLLVTQCLVQRGFKGSGDQVVLFFLSLSPCPIHSEVAIFYNGNSPLMRLMINLPVNSLSLACNMMELLKYHHSSYRHNCAAPNFCVLTSNSLKRTNPLHNPNPDPSP